ncbi:MULTISPECIES: phosphoribosyltransferase [Novosphingobium]|uniref:Phosphoribosyltransferase n=1 Tax=Novosphingobium decolorationis TaxID=2698673 RepID=A0ABX8E4R8_9SPHN|nr:MULTISPECIES: phosphoribosyltransferase family protein [Novosphingobium]MED5544577.1 phosphoribosyltransferase family protein [Pseudomonadota bacterium]QVM83935.1 phosphoribosyltransferase [Novosphingobium decolorationis]GAM05174.1 phosphoribosyltransferase [Novosphingobium sp. MBES04]
MDDTSEPQLQYLEYYEDFLAKVRVVSRKVADSDWMPDFVIGIGRGGLVPGCYVSHQLDVPMLSIDHSAKQPDFADELLAKLAVMSGEGKKLLFIDDINDSGGTIEFLRARLAELGADASFVRFAVIITNTSSRAKTDYWAQTIDRSHDKRWFVFPWESVSTRETITAEALSVPERLA